MLDNCDAKSVKVSIRIWFSHQAIMSNSKSENTLGVPQRSGLRRRSVSLDTSELHRNQDFDQAVPDPHPTKVPQSLR